MSRDYGITKLYPYRDSANRLAFRGDVGVDGTTLFYPIRVGGQMLLRGACSDGVLYGYPFRAGDQLYARTLAADVISPPRINWSMTCRYWWDSCGGALPLRYQMSGHWAHCGGEKFSAAKDFYVTGDSTGILWWSGRSAVSFCNSGCKWGTEELGIEGSVWSHDTYPEAVGGKYLAFDGTVVLIGRNEGDYVGEFMTSLRAYPLGTSYSNWPCANFGRPTPDTDCGVITGSWTDPDPGACASESACFAWLQAWRDTNPSGSNYKHTGGLLSAEVAPL